LTIKVYKNFLDNQTHKELFDLIQSTKFDWYQVKCVQPPLITKDTQFCHWLLALGLDYAIVAPSNFYKVFKPLFKQLDITILHRAKLNLTVRQDELRILGGFHNDFYRDKEQTQPIEELKVAIYYFNTTNGQTLIKENGKIKKIDCEANSLVTFSNTLEHTGMTHTDEQFRYVLNLNYI